MFKGTDESFICQLTAKKKPTHTFIVLSDRSPEEPFMKLAKVSSRTQVIEVKDVRSEERKGKSRRATSLSNQKLEDA